MRHEWRLLRADPGAWLAVCVLAAAIVAGVTSGVRWTRVQERALAAASAADARQFGQLRAQAESAEVRGAAPTPFDAYASPGFLGLFYPRYAALPPAPLAALSVGQSDVYPYYFRVSGERRDSFLDAEEIENPLNQLSGRFDLAFAIVYVLPLVTLGLCYNVLAGEREGGTLRLALAQPVRLSTLLAGKAAVRLSLVAGVTLAVALATLAASGVALGAPDAPLLLATWAAAVGAYAAVWVALAALVNTFRVGAAACAVALGSLWLAWVVLVPSFVSVAAAARHPVPPRAELIAASRRASPIPRAEIIPLIERYYAEHPGQRPPGLEVAKYNFPLYWTATQREAERRMAPVVARYDRARAAQQRLVDWLRVLSPAVVAQEAFNDLAGTGVARHHRFLAAVDEFHRAHRGFYEPRTFAQVRITSADYDRMPRFAFAEEPASAPVRRAAAGVVTLVASALLLGAAAFWRARRGGDATVGM